MKQQKLVYVYVSTANKDAWEHPVELPLQEYFDAGWLVASYQFSMVDLMALATVLLEKEE